jgi:hypothetical protein
MVSFMKGKVTQPIPEVKVVGVSFSDVIVKKDDFKIRKLFGK